MVVNDYVTDAFFQSADNAIIDITRTGVAGKHWYVSYITWRVSGGNTTNLNNINVMLLDGTTEIVKSVISKSASDGAVMIFTPPNPIQLTEGNNLHYHADASGNAGTIITLNIGTFLK